MLRKELIESIAATISDYRQGEIPPPNADHVDRWIRQFDGTVQEPMLAEMDFVLKQGYFSRNYLMTFLLGLARLRRLPGVGGLWRNLRLAFARLIGFGKQGRGAPAVSRSFWRDVNFLDIQKHGGSQRAMLRLLDEALNRDKGFTLAHCGSTTGPFLYLDDILFTGNRIILDLRQWLQTLAPPRAEIVVAVIACYRRGLVYTHKALLRAAAEVRKTIRVHWLRSVEFAYGTWPPVAVEGFHPALIPDDPLAQAYAVQLAAAGFPPRLRIPGSGPSRLFLSESGRHLLEQQFLLAGLKIRSWYRNPQDVMRPLGYHNLKCLGFGAPLLTYRNCPNNCPLAWWWDTAAVPSSTTRNQWYPLFPRKV